MPESEKPGVPTDIKIDGSKKGPTIEILILATLGPLVCFLIWRTR